MPIKEISRRGQSTCRLNVYITSLSWKYETTKEEEVDPSLSSGLLSFFLNDFCDLE